MNKCKGNTEDLGLSHLYKPYTLHIAMHSFQTLKYLTPNSMSLRILTIMSKINKNKKNILSVKEKKL